MGQIFSRLEKLYEYDFNFCPRTFTMPEDEEQLHQHSKKNKQPIYIVKPGFGSQGDGIFLAKGSEKIAPLTNEQTYLVQEYLSSPYLIPGDERKFDLRVYILVTSINPLTAYIANEGLVRFCTEKYEAPSKSNLSKTLMHLTNYSLNKLSSKFVKCEDIESKEASKQPMKAFLEGLEDGEIIFEQIKDTCTKALLGLQPYLEMENGVFMKGLKCKSKVFQILGFDIFIDKNRKAWLLEINDHPSLNINFELEGPKGLIKSESPIDKFVKCKVLKDAFMIMTKQEQSTYLSLLPSAEHECYDGVWKSV